jgi:hypothetical protein
MKKTFIFIALSAIIISCSQSQNKIDNSERNVILAGKKFNESRRTFGVPILTDELELIHKDNGQVGWRNPKMPTEVPQYYHKTCFIVDSIIVKEASSFLGVNGEHLFIDYTYFDNNYYSYNTESQGFACRIVYNSKDGAVMISKEEAFALLDKWGIIYK